MDKRKEKNGKFLNTQIMKNHSVQNLHIVNTMNNQKFTIGAFGKRKLKPVHFKDGTIALHQIEANEPATTASLFFTSPDSYLDAKRLYYVWHSSSTVKPITFDAFTKSFLDLDG